MSRLFGLVKQTAKVAKVVAKEVVSGDFVKETSDFAREISGSPRHQWDQSCPNCDKMASYIGETFVEGGGRRSWTDGIDVTYQCPNCGHIFSKRWTIPNLGD